MRQIFKGTKCFIYLLKSTKLFFCNNLHFSLIPWSKGIYMFLFTCLCSVLKVMTAKVLIIGSGGREHTLAWKILQSSNVGKVFVCPGNAGTFNLSKAENIELPINNHNAISNWCIDNSIDLVVIGPEAPLADGLCNNLKSRSILCFGPTKEAAQIESSKLFSKEFMDRHGIPTARWKSFTDADQAIRFIRTSVFNGVVVKASGLAAGKGVIVASSTDEAIKAVQEMIKVRFGY